MKLRALRAPAIAAVVAGLGTHFALLYGIPVWATDYQFAAAIKRGAKWNTLRHNPVPKAGSTSVPLANPDSFTSSAGIDLSKGSLVLAGPVPKSCAYWSVSVFAHNTDTALIMSDRNFPSGTFRIGIAREKTDIPQPVDAIALLPSDKAFLLLRCFMRDANDAAYMVTLESERRKITLQPANPARGVVQS